MASVALCACPQALDDDFVAGNTALVTAPGSGGAAPPGSGGAGPPGSGAGPPGSGAGAGNGGIDSSGGAAADAGQSAGMDGGRGGTGGDSAPLTQIPWLEAADGSCHFGTPEQLSGLELGSSSERGPALDARSLTLVLSSDQSGNEDLFETTRSGRGTHFSPAISLSSLNTDSDEGTPFMASNGLALYFASNRPGGAGGRDIYVATRLVALGSFFNAALLPNVNDTANDELPRLSADERTLVFTSTRAGGVGGADLWVATRASKWLAFGTPLPIDGVNTIADEEGGHLSANQLTVVFDSTRGGGLGGHDLWLSTRGAADTSFGAPVNLTELNSSSDEVNVRISDDGEELFFSSNRQDGVTFRLWRSARTCD